MYTLFQTYLIILKFLRQQYRSRLTNLVIVVVKKNVNVHAALHTASRNLHTPMIKEFEDQERILECVTLVIFLVS